MSAPYDAVMKLLEREGFEVLRTNGHTVWQQKSSGLVHITPNTASDFRSWRNNLAQLRRLITTGESGHYRRALRISETERVEAEMALRRKRA